MISVLAIQRIKVIVDKRGQTMCFVKFYDENGAIDGTVFSSTYETYQKEIDKGHICIVEGKIENKTGLSFIVKKIKRIK